jgi:hypothetical protein
MNKNLKDGEHGVFRGNIPEDCRLPLCNSVKKNHSSALKKEPAVSAEKLASFCQNLRHHIPDDNTLEYSRPYVPKKSQFREFAWKG